MEDWRVMGRLLGHCGPERGSSSRRHHHLQPLRTPPRGRLSVRSGQGPASAGRSFTLEATGGYAAAGFHFLLASSFPSPIWSHAAALMHGCDQQPSLHSCCLAKPRPWPSSWNPPTGSIHSLTVRRPCSMRTRRKGQNWSGFSMGATLSSESCAKPMRPDSPACSGISRKAPTAGWSCA